MRYFCWKLINVILCGSSIKRRAGRHITCRIDSGGKSCKSIESIFDANRIRYFRLPLHILILVKIKTPPTPGRFPKILLCSHVIYTWRYLTSMSLPAAANTSGRFRKPACDNISAMLEWYMDGVPEGCPLPSWENGKPAVEALAGGGWSSSCCCCCCDMANGGDGCECGDRSLIGLVAVP